MIIVTGGLGFIGSCLLQYLNELQFKDVVVVDDFEKKHKLPNIANKHYTHCIQRENLFDFIDQNQHLIQFVFHLGARTDTTEKNVSIFDELNLNYSKQLWHKCVAYGLPIVYASSAATYGNGELGYDDNEEVISKLNPMNPYGQSKQDFDVWVLAQEQKPYHWVGLKFFNVYGPNEYHKGRMASVVWHAFQQLKQDKEIKLFKSYNPNFKDGQQLRDFIYVKDLVKVCVFFMLNRKNRSGIYNLGTGQARSFIALVKPIFDAVQQEEQISFIDMPLSIRDTYQYFTEANMRKLRQAGYEHPFYTVEEGVKEYVRDYLIENKYW